MKPWWQKLVSRGAVKNAVPETSLFDELVPEMPSGGALSAFSLTPTADVPPGASGWATYDKMQADPQVKACLAVKKFAVLSRGWELHPASVSPEDVDVAAFVRAALLGMEGSLNDALFHVLDALAKGVSVLEINYRLMETGKVSLKSLKAKDPALFTLETDEFGNLLSLSGPDSACYPAEKFVIYAYMPSYDRPFGTSDLRAAYRAWRAKDWIQTWWNKHLEKFGTPTVTASYPAKGGFGAEQQRQLLSLVSAVQNETALVLPDDIKLSLLESGRQADVAFADAIAFLDRAIAKSILGQTLTSDSTPGGSTYALGQVHWDIFGYYLQKLQRDLEDTVMNAQVISRLVALNYGPQTLLPTFHLGALDDGRLASAGSLITELVRGGVVAPEEPWIRAYLGLPAASPPSASVPPA